jgi:hypothetical protein
MIGHDVDVMEMRVAIWILVLLVAIFALMPLWRKHIQLRFHSNHQRHGYFWAQTSNGQRVPCNFSVEDPEDLRSLSKRQLRDMFEQARSHGYLADTLVIDVGLVTRTYRLDPRTGRPVVLSAPVFPR